MKNSSRCMTFGLAFASAALTGCVGYNSESDGASGHAQALGVTQQEESHIREALAQKPMTAEEIEAAEKALEERELPSEWGTQSYASASGRMTVDDWQPCASDHNCKSHTCNQAGLCQPRGTYVDSYYWNGGGLCMRDADCATRRCVADPSLGVPYGSCNARLATDFNLTQDNGETDVDCGGPNSPYTCPLGNKCQIDSDCALGVCFAQQLSTGIDKRCRLGNGSTADLGRPWRSTTAVTGAPYDRLITLATELSRDAQITKVTNAPQRKSVTLSGGAVMIKAKADRTYQHDTCTRHLVANGCSSVSVNVRTNRAAYDLIICPRTKRSAIGISTAGSAFKPFETLVAATSTTPARISFASSIDRGGGLGAGGMPLADDPFLCNNGHTVGVRYLSKTNGAQPAPVNAVAALSTDIAGAGARWDGYVIQESGLAYSTLSSSTATSLLSWFDQLQRTLLMNAACTRGRLSYGGTRQGAAPTWAGHTAAEIQNLCKQYTPWNVSRSGSTLPAETWSNALTAGEIAFIKENVPYYNSYDIYSIDPEGNPYLPENMNMQYGWDGMFSGYTFQDYALSYGLTLVPTSTTYTYSGTTYNVWGTTSTSTFGWTF